MEYCNICGASAIAGCYGPAHVQTRYSFYNYNTWIDGNQEPKMSKEDRTVTLSGVEVKESVLRAAVEQLDAPQTVLRSDLKVGEYYSPRRRGGVVYRHVKIRPDVGAAGWAFMDADGIVLTMYLENYKGDRVYRRTSFTDTGD